MQIKLARILPHLYYLYTKKPESIGYAETFSTDILQFAQSLQEVNFSSNRKEILGLLNNYLRVSTVAQVGDYAITGDVINLWPAGYETPLKILFFDEKIEQIYSYDLLSGIKLEQIEGFYLSTFVQVPAYDVKEIHLHPYRSQQETFHIFANNVPQAEVNELEIEKTDFTYPNLYWQNFQLLKQAIRDYEERGLKVKIFTRHTDKLPEDLLHFIDTKHQLLSELGEDLAAGFVSESSKLVVLTDREIFGTIYLSTRRQDSTTVQKLLTQIEGELSLKDYVVHDDYGVGQYMGLTQEIVDGRASEYLDIRYAGNDQLLLPIDQLHKLHRYIGDGALPELSRLKGGSWENLKQRTRKLAQIKAKELLEHYARRALAQAAQVSVEDTKEYKDFLSKFSFHETKDQLQATAEIVADMSKEVPMNRLLIGDVGFGKTEVAMRAAYKMLEAGHGVLVLCPTTVLAAQHYRVFQDRFRGTDFKVTYISRLHSKGENKKLVDEINQGKFNIVVGTHRLLTGDLDPKGFGLLIVDEEQKFGVKQKEKLRRLNYKLHYLSISATPIPRTMSMALAKIQDLSLITTAPPGRKPILTYEIKHDWHKIIEAMNNEFSRGGQVYFVHNRVRTLDGLAAQLEKLLPSVRVTVAHGQMSPAKLDAAMQEFYTGRSQVLLCTTIIENGLDLENVNTIIIDHADKFGLSSLYQLRGRVGRTDKQAYCYLVSPPKADKQHLEEQEIARATRSAEYGVLSAGSDGGTPHSDNRSAGAERVESIVQNAHIGAGLHIASKDLEMRGAGELLGAQQSGHISKIGYALYMQLIGEEIDRLRAQYQTGVLPEFVTL